MLDKHSRVAYTDVNDDETAVTAAVLVLNRAVEWFADRGVERVLSANGYAYCWHL